MSTPPNEQNRRRSERVMLQIAVTLLAETPQRTQIREYAQTMVVNAHGGMMRVKADLLAGQPLTLIHEKSGKRERAHVVRIEQPSPDYYAVAFEFARPAPNFWPVVFPPADWGAKST